MNKDSNLNKKAYVNICACLNSLGDRIFWQQYIVHFMHKIKINHGTLNFMPSGVTCDIRIRKHKRSSNAVYTLTKKSDVIHYVLLLYSTSFFQGSASISYVLKPD